MDWNETMQDYLRTLNPSTAQQYRAALGDFATWYEGSYGELPDPTLLTDEEAREYRGYLSGTRGLKASTVNTRLAALKGLVRHAGRRIEVRGVRKVESPVEPLDGRELGRLLAALEGDRWMDRRNVALAGTLARAGLRISECIALSLDDVELNDRSGWALIRRGKGLKERRVPLSREARRGIVKYLAVRPSTDTRALFVSRSGKAMGASDVERMVTSAARRAGIKKPVTPHTLRHTFATRFLRAGGDLATLQNILGHRNLATTARYLHPDAARVQEMVEDL